MDPDLLYIVFAVGLLLLFFFSIAEVAIRQINQSYKRLEITEYPTSFRGILLRHEQKTILTVQLGLGLGLITLGLSSFGILFSLLPVSLSVEVAFSIAVLASLLVNWVLFLAIGMLARLVSPIALLKTIGTPLLFFFILFYPLTFILYSVFGLFSEKHAGNTQEMLATSLVFQPFAVKPSAQEEEVLTLTNEVDSKIFHNALEFKNVKVRECMVPRTEIDAIEIDEGVEVLRDAFIETGHSKILIYKDSLDHIMGYCHQFSLFKNPTNLEDILTPIEAIPENMLARELFVKFITEHRSIALVLDEFGGTSGLVTLEDVMEEIIGDINDEYDEEDLLEQELPEKGSYLFSARQEIDYLNEKYHLNLPEGDYETLGGFILSVLEEIPSAGDIIVVPPFEIRILSMDEHRINTIHLSVRLSKSEE